MRITITLSGRASRLFANINKHKRSMLVNEIINKATSKDLIKDTLSSFFTEEEIKHLLTEIIQPSNQMSDEPKMAESKEKKNVATTNGDQNNSSNQQEFRIQL